MDDPLTAGAAVLTLTGAIGVLWKVIHGKFEKVEDRLITKLDKCEEHHNRVTETIIVMNREIGTLAGRQEATVDLATDVLRILAESADQKAVERLKQLEQEQAKQKAPSNHSIESL